MPDLAGLCDLHGAPTIAHEPQTSSPTTPTQDRWRHRRVHAKHSTRHPAGSQRPAARRHARLQRSAPKTASSAMAGNSPSPTSSASTKPARKISIRQHAILHLIDRWRIGQHLDHGNHLCCNHIPTSSIPSPSPLSNVPDGTSDSPSPTRYPPAAPTSSSSCFRRMAVESTVATLNGSSAHFPAHQRRRQIAAYYFVGYSANPTRGTFTMNWSHEHQLRLHAIDACKTPPRPTPSTSSNVTTTTGTRT